VRIAVVTTSYPAHARDASGHFVHTEVVQLERAGHEVVVVTPEVGGAFGWPGVGARLRERPSRLLDAAVWAARARGQLARLAVQRVVAHWAVPCAWPVGIASRGELEAVSHGADVRLLVAMPRAVRERAVRAIARRAASWRFVSGTLRDALLESLAPRVRVEVDRVARVEAAAIEIPDVHAAAERIARDLGGARVAVSVGRLVRSKRVDRAIEHVATMRDADALVVVGDGPERGRLEALARSRGVDAHFTGVLPRDEALAWMRAAHVLLFASEEEGASTVLREAHALGTPVLVLPPVSAGVSR
jgi:glycosyltransferase involved in cell wall biosynthesis